MELVYCDGAMAYNKNLLTIVLGRHAREPHIEGGGKVMYETARALTQANVETYLISFNYRNQWYNHGEKELCTEDFDSINISTNIISQNIVLNTRVGALIANIIEPIKLLKLLSEYKYILKRGKKKSIIVFIGNANKYMDVILRGIEKIIGTEGRRILVVLKKEDLSSTKIRIIRPHIILATSREIAYLAKHVYKNKRVVQAYPPVDLSIYRPLNRRKICEKIFSELGSDKLLLYIGRVNELRFPTQTLRYIALALRGIDKEAKLLIATLPDILSNNWIKRSLELMRKEHLKNVLILPKILTTKEKVVLMNCSRAFIFPSITTTAIEPPISVLEAVSCGLPIVTTGHNSTCEVAYATGGFVCRNFCDEYSLKRLFIELLSRAPNVTRARTWAENNLSYTIFRKKLMDIYKLIIGNL